MLNSKRNFYNILNATSNATTDELKTNYKQLVLQCHPDKIHHQQQQQQQQQSHQKSQQQIVENNINKLENDNTNNADFVAITEAWNCLKDPLKRKQYDAELLLNKFHTHNNIYAHIKLNEMKKELNTGNYIDDSDDGGNDEEEERKKSVDKTKEVCNTSKYVYTYDCRCGGQYIVDESAEQYCRTGKYGSQMENSDNNKVDFNGVDSDDADDIAQNNKNSPNNIECKERNAGDGDGGGGSAAAAADDTVAAAVVGDSGSGSEGVVFNEDNVEEGGELIVECSECSLVIILNG